MGKLEKVKTIIDLLKSLIITLIVGLFGMVSYGFININHLNTLQWLFITLAIIFDIVILIAVSKIIRKVNELEDL